MSDRLALPVLPPPADPPPFPVIGVIAPVVLAAGLFAVLGTPTVLLLAVFSPVLAVAAVLDGRLQGRRRARRAAERHAVALDELERELEERRRSAAALLHRTTPTAAALAAAPGAWAGRPPSDVLVLGTAAVPCAPVVTGTPTVERERGIVAAGALVPDAPLAVPASTTVAVVAPAPLGAAFQRAVGVARLRGGGSGGCELLEQPDGATADLVVAIAPDGSGRILHASGPAAACAVRAFQPTFLSGRAADGLLEAGGSIELAALLADPADGTGLSARFLIGPEGPLDVDLVSDGPHAVVGGTTGSGKSALLTAWLLALTAAHPPDRLQLLLVDCKGGAAFAPLAGLPHVVGVVTDLQPAQAERAVSSLRAELLRRERELGASGAADAAAGGLPRLVVVVDEYRALVEAAPALAVLFADLAARGRSLGVHLVLCTQRPGTGVRDEVLANCALRISLRVQDPADSRAVVGSAAAALLGRDPVGAAVLVTDRERRVRVARVDAPAVAAAVTRSAAAHPDAVVRRPWLPALPVDLALGGLPTPPAPLVPLGLTDLPEEQRQPLLVWDPVAQPRLLIAGDARSGRTTALAVVAAGLDAAVLRGSVSALWDRLLVDGAQERARPLLVDDLDHLLDRFDEPHRAAVVDALLRRLRDPAAGPTVITTRGPGAWGGLPIRPLAGAVDEVVLLALRADDHLALGGERSGVDDRRPPGRARFAGALVQLARTEAARSERPPVPLPLPLPEGPMLLVAESAGALGDRLEESGRTVLPPSAPVEGWGRQGVVVVGAPAAWHPRWQALAEARTALPVLVGDCAAADLRTLLGVSGPLPPVDGGDDALLLLPDGRTTRVRLP